MAGVYFKVFAIIIAVIFVVLEFYPWQQLQCVTYGMKKKEEKKKKEEVTQSLYHKFNNNNLYSSEIVLFSVNSVSFVFHLNPDSLAAL